MDFLLQVFMTLWFAVKIESCRVKTFMPPERGKALKGHVIKNLTIQEKDMCELHCYLEESCQSYNLKPPSHGEGWQCQLSSSDAHQHPDNLTSKAGWMYGATKNPCSSSPCVKNATCQPNYLEDNSYQCICPRGFTGDNCEKDIDECTSGAHNCSPNASCANSVGSFTCSCKVGFTGNGTNCTDIDECTSGAHYCSLDAVCVNSVGSFACSCSPGFTWNGTNCTDIDECTSDAHNCSLDAVCANSVGAFTCSCKLGFTGNGTNCTGNKGFSVANPARSCKEVQSETPDAPNGTYFLSFDNKETQHSYCHMDTIQGCGEGPWTLVMKISGFQTTFKYSSELWVNKTAFNVDGGETGFDGNETKLPSYWSAPFTELCLGMKVNEITSWINIKNNENKTLYNLIADGTYRETRIGRDAWKSLIPGSSLQMKCDKEGFNVVSQTEGYPGLAKSRIGIIADETNKDCSTACSCDSRIGFGSQGGDDNNKDIQDTSNSCGNEASKHSPDNGIKHTKAFCYILLK